MIGGRIGRLPALLALVCFAMPGSAQPLRYSAEQYVLPSDCVAEQNAYRGDQPSVSVKELLEAPWAYKYNGLGALNGPDDFRLVAALSDDEAAAQQEGRGRAEPRLRACVYRAAAARMEANFRKVTTGLPVKALVSQGDCQAEQSAFVTAYSNDRYNKLRASRSGYGLDGEARAAATGLVNGVQYNHYLTSPGEPLERQNFLNLAQSSVQTAQIGVSFKNEVQAAHASLGACLYRAAAGRVGEASGDLPRAQGVVRAEPEVATCAADRLRDMNREIADLDSRLDVFLRTSEYATTTGPKGASPMLAVTIWALKSQADAIRKYCPDVEAHRRRIMDLELSLKSAQQACDQIQSGGATCKPAAPETIS
jgi:hypothetical protein